MLVIENKEEDEVDSPEVSNQLRSRSAIQINRNLNERPALTLE
jgi:hypothetical protein